MKVSKTDNRFKTGFPKPITGLPKKPILTSLYLTLQFLLISLHRLLNALILAVLLTKPFSAVLCS